MKTYAPCEKCGHRRSPKFTNEELHAADEAAADFAKFLTQRFDLPIHAIPVPPHTDEMSFALESALYAVGFQHRAAIIAIGFIRKVGDETSGTVSEFVGFQGRLYRWETLADILFEEWGVRDLRRIYETAVSAERSAS